MPFEANKFPHQPTLTHPTVPKMPILFQPTKNHAADSTQTHLVQNPHASFSMPVANAASPTTTSLHATETPHPTLFPSNTEATAPFNPMPTFKPCNINIDLFENLLQSHPNRFLVNYIIDGLRNGFDIGFSGDATPTLPKNLKSAYQNKEGVQQAINKEILRDTQRDRSQTHLSLLPTAPP